MFSLIKNQQGNTALIAVMGLAIAGGALMVSQQNLQVQKVERDLIKRSEGEVIVDKMRALASFLVANNVIICKQGLFEEDKKYLENTDPDDPNYESDNAQVLKDYGKRCKWTGKQVTNGVSEDIDLEDVKFSNKRYFGYEDDGSVKEELRNHKDFGALVFDVDTVKLIDSALDSEQKEVEPVRGKLSFRLYDFSFANDSLGIADRIGVESVTQSAADDDYYAVLIKAEAVYNRVFAWKKKDAEDDSVDAEKEKAVKKEEKLERYFALRRPIAIPKVDINTPSCKTACDSSLSINNNPECRGPMGFDNIREVELTGRVTNLGPGVLYNLKLEKSIEYDKKLYPNRQNPETVSVSVMGDRDYLLPGETVEWVDSIQCEVFKTTVNETIRCSTWRRNAAGNPVCWDSSGNVVDPAAGDDLTSNSGVDQHDEVAGQIYYKLSAGNEDIYKDPGGVIEENISDLPIYYNGQLLDLETLREIRAQMERDILANEADRFRIQEDFLRRIRVPIGAPLRSPSTANTTNDDNSSSTQSNEWTAKSTIEPKRIITSISAEEGFPRKKETTVNIKIIPTH